jgi:hypothetical protein
MGTAPRFPSTIRTRAWVQIGMQSVSTTTPSSVSSSVSRTSVPGRYRRRTARTGTVGAICHRPCSTVPRSAAKQAAESKRGMQSQSMEPSRPTSAAVWQFPMIA